MKITIPLLCLAPFAVSAQDASVQGAIVDDLILPGFAALTASSEALAQTATEDCAADSEALRAAYGEAFDAWINVSHFRFGPTEVDNRGFALAFWPDTRGATPKTLGELIRDEDPIANSSTDYAEMSVAARGFYAMEFLLYDEAIQSLGNGSYQCQLVQTVAGDIASTAAAIEADWITDYADVLRKPSAAGTYRTDEEALQELFKSLSTGLEFTHSTRVGRPLGTFDRPRPLRAEAWRSGRSAQHVEIALHALGGLATALAQSDTDLTGALEASFAEAQTQLTALNDPVFASVSEPISRLKIEVIQRNINDIRALVALELGPKLGVVEGFNSLDGD